MIDTKNQLVISPDHRCRGCHRGPDEVEFEKQSGRDLPRTECKDCRRQSRNRDRRTARANMREPPSGDGSVEKLMSLTMQRTVKLPAVRQLAGAMLDRFGGTDGLADMTFHHIELLLLKNPGTPKAIEALRFVYKLIATGLEEQKIEVNFQSMSEEDLEESVMSYLRDRNESLAGNGNGN